MRDEQVVTRSNVGAARGYRKRFPQNDCAPSGGASARFAVSDDAVTAAGWSRRCRCR